MENVFDKAYRYILENNTGDSNPYHNNRHCLFVFEKSTLILFDTLRKQYNIKSTDKMELGLAALFHDFNHSGGKLIDSENIKLAIAGLNDFLDKNPDINVDRNSIANIIEASEHPHKEMELNPLQKILRDADMIGSISDNWFDVLTSIASESNKNILDFIPENIAFLDTVEFYTPYCKVLLRERRDKIKQDLLKLQSDLMFQ
jgi:hypothetical protein